MSGCSIFCQIDVLNRGFSELSYVQIVGTVTSFNNRNKLTIRSIKKVDDPHAIYHHLLHCMVDTLTYERGPPVRPSVFNIHPKPNWSIKPAEYVGNEYRSHGDIPHPSDPQVDDTLVDEIIRLNLGESSTTQQSAASRSMPTQSPRPITPPEHQKGSYTGSSAKNKGKQKESTVHEEPQPSGSSSAGPVTDLGLSSPNTHNSFGEHSSATTSERSPAASPSIARSSSVSCDAHNYPPNNSLLLSGYVPQRPPERHSSSPAKPRKRDPYSHLTNLERDIILSILNAGTSPSLYPTEGRKPEQWEGVPIHVILTALRSRHQLTRPVFLWVRYALFFHHLWGLKDVINAGTRLNIW